MIAEVVEVNLTNIIVRCPYCLKLHRHGNATKELSLTNYGERVPHCRNSELAEYTLVCNEKTKRGYTK